MSIRLNNEGDLKNTIKISIQTSMNVISSKLDVDNKTNDTHTKLFLLRLHTTLAHSHEK